MKINLERFFISICGIAVCIIWKSSTLISNQNVKHQPASAILQSPMHHMSNNGNHSESTDSKTKPYFILHIGPPKTATTYIQCNLQKLSKGLADDDYYYFVGKNCPRSDSKMENNEKNIPGHYLMMGLNDANTHNRGYEALKSRMDYHRLEGNSIIYSNEAFANHLIDQNSTWDCLQSMLSGWNVRVVIGYRHYFDWIRSFYYQTNKQNDKLHKKWPNQGNGKPHPSFLSFLEYHLERRESGDLSIDGGLKNDAFGHHLTISAYKKFSPHFDDIQFLNLHDDDDMVTDFVCRILPHAGKTCRKLSTLTDEDKEEETHSLAKRGSQSFDAHRISEAAFDKGYISERSPKEAVVEMVKKKIKETGMKSLVKFWICPSPSVVARLLNVSIEYENEMLEISKGDDVSAPEMEKAKNSHISMYRKNEADDRFCDLDPELILKDENWVNILSKIGKKTAKGIANNYH